MWSFSVIHSTRPLIVVFVLFSDIDECALDDNNCTKGGANCTNTVGSFNCTCQMKYFWNGTECEGLFSVPLSCSMGISFHGVSAINLNLLRNNRISGCVSGCLGLHIFVCVCVHMFTIQHFLWNVEIGRFWVPGFQWSGAEITAWERG